jgi:short-subunit dehydrogenase
METAMKKPVCAIIGIGPGNGIALARRFTQAGYAIAMLSRSAEQLAMYSKEIEGSRIFPCDAGEPKQLTATLAAVREQMGPVDVLCYNAGGGSWSTPEEATPEEMEAAFRLNAVGLLTAAQAVIPGMVEAGNGAIMISGATASKRGGAKTTAFAAAKAAQRSIAQSLARHLGPKGIHVALFIIDGVIDLPRTRKMLPDKPDTFFLKAGEIAETVYHVARQPKSAWSFEVDLRPFAEHW